MSSPTRQKPNKVLSVRFTESRELDAWPYEDFPGDPYWQGGTTPKPYRWQVTMNVTTQAHGDPSTRDPYRYNGLDVYVGEWVADISTGKALKIIKITEKLKESATVVLEDVDRYNTFIDETGTGIFGIPSNGIVFSISDAKLPILNPLPGDITDAIFTQEVNGRFNNNNPLYRTRVVQTSHNLNDNDTIWVDPADGRFKRITDESELKRAVGTVDRTGPGADVFYFVPTTKVVEGIDPPLPGRAGEIIYADPFTGEMTTDPTERTKAIYIQLTDSVADTTSSTTDTVVTGTVLSINEVDVTFTGNTMQSVVNNINATSQLHNVDAVLLAGSNETVTDSSQLAYGICACIGTSTVAQINGVSVAFNDDTNGQAEFGFSAVNAIDMAIAINNANIPNITANGFTSIQLVITETTGQPISILNVTSDDSGLPFAGNGSCSGVPVYTDAGGGQAIDFTNETGGGIIFSDVTGTPVADLGLTSVRNGELPIGLVVEQYISEGTETGGTSVYATLDDLPPFGVVGSQAFVVDSVDNNGNKADEWTMFLWDGFNWVKTADEDSARTDARSMEAYVAFDSTSPVEIGTLSDSKRVAQVVVEVITVFDGNPVMNIGDENDPLRLMQDDMLDLSTSGSFSDTSNFIYQTGNDITVIATFRPNGATQGLAKVIVTYI